MAQFHIKVLTAQGECVERTFAAATADEAGALALRQGLHVVEVRGGSHFPSLSPPRPRFDLALFSQELLALLRAGLSLIEALETLDERQQQAAGASPLIGTLVRRMREGQSFSQALQAAPAEFPDLFVASMAASEQTGEMVGALERYLRYHEQVTFIRQKLISASVYPALLLVVGMGVALFLLCFLVPRFSHIYEGLDTQLPLASRVLLAWGGYASAHVVLVSALAAGLLAGAFVLYRSGRLQPALLSLLQRNRWLAGRLQLLQLSRFYRSLSLLLRGGIPVLKALGMTERLLSRSLQAPLRLALQEVSQGQALSDALERHGLT
ncbi:MAG TPA: type II secretion system F family protein, partial [Moraxellaceae bacterium]|nr:type II secretion system F family protein [Moraxellaceae bacterium]